MGICWRRWKSAETTSSISSIRQSQPITGAEQTRAEQSSHRQMCPNKTSIFSRPQMEEWDLLSDGSICHSHQLQPFTRAEQTRAEQSSHWQMSFPSVPNKTSIFLRPQMEDCDLRSDG
ncbi:uncharacterized protein LOC143783510 isoform X2 [Ranitomeya variabilis]|uniref:uncharacterized protein LOC143783510 isoform X2 n=1 Tax=Ranitomeya variabilis TaxID=490064 RepID=UPI004055D8BC